MSHADPQELIDRMHTITEETAPEETPAENPENDSGDEVPESGADDEPQKSTTPAKIEVTEEEIQAEMEVSFKIVCLGLTQ